MALTGCIATEKGGVWWKSKLGVFVCLWVWESGRDKKKRVMWSSCIDTSRGSTIPFYYNDKILGPYWKLVILFMILRNSSLVFSHRQKMLSHIVSRQWKWHYYLVSVLGKTTKQEKERDGTLRSFFGSQANLFHEISKYYLYSFIFKLVNFWIAFLKKIFFTMWSLIEVAFSNEKTPPTPSIFSLKANLYFCVKM